MARAGGEIVEVPITFVDRRRGASKMSFGIVVEALLLVTWWGMKDLSAWAPVRARSTKPMPTVP